MTNAITHVTIRYGQHDFGHPVCRMRDDLAAEGLFIPDAYSDDYYGAVEVGTGVIYDTLDEGVLEVLCEDGRIAALYSIDLDFGPKEANA